MSKRLEYDRAHNDFDWTEDGKRIRAISVNTPYGQAGELEFFDIAPHHIVRCVNYHERLIEMVQALSYDYHLATGGKHHVSAGALLAELAKTEEA